MASTKVTIRGGRETAAALRALGRESAQRAVLQKSLRPSALAVRRDARALLRNRTKGEGDTAASIAIETRRGSRQADAVLRVGHRMPQGNLSHLIEFGTAERVQTTTGRRTGRMPAIRYMTDAFALHAERVIVLFAAAFVPEFKRALAKQAVSRAVYGLRRR